MWTQLDNNFAPTGAPAGATEAISQTGSFSFSFEGLSDGTYQALYVGWRDPNNPAGARLLGMYWNNPDSSGIMEIPVGPGATVTGPVQPPQTITISETNRTVSDLVITGDLDLWQ